MMGELRKRGQVWWIRYYVDGHRYEESSGSKLKREATTLLRQREGDLSKGLPVSPKVGRLTFTQAVAQVVADYKANSRSTSGDVEARIRLHLGPYFRGRRMVSITTADVRNYVRDRQEEGAANATINRELAILKRAFKLAKEARLLFYIPKISMLKESNVRTGYFEHDDFERVRDALPDYLQGVVTLAYLTGWRVPSEILTLSWGQVDRKGKMVTLDAGTTKNDEPRTLPYARLPELHNMIEAAWKDHRALAAEGTICPLLFHRRGVEIKGFRKAWATATKRAGVPGKIPHDFRRTAVRNLVRAGVPEKIVMEITGHVTRSVFERYNIVNETDKLDALGRLAQASDELAAGTKRGQSSKVEMFEAS